MRDALRRPVRPHRGGPDGRADDGFLSLEWVLTVPVMMLLAALVVAAGFIVRDVMLLQEAARVGARVAATTAGQQPVRAAVHDAAPELRGGMAVAVSPMVRRPGDHVEVVVTTTRRYGPLSHRLVARSTARVEPILEGGGPIGPVGPLRPFDPAAPRGAVPVPPRGAPP